MIVVLGCLSVFECVLLASSKNEKENELCCAFNKSTGGVFVIVVQALKGTCSVKRHSKDGRSEGAPHRGFVMLSQ